MSINHDTIVKENGSKPSLESQQSQNRSRASHTGMGLINTPVRLLADSQGHCGRLTAETLKLASKRRGWPTFSYLRNSFHYTWVCVLDELFSIVGIFFYKCVTSGLKRLKSTTRLIVPRLIFELGIAGGLEI